MTEATGPVTLRTYQDEAVQELRGFLGKYPRAAPLVIMPTGTGKSFVLAAFIQRELQADPGARVLVATHVRELINQNHVALLRLWPDAPAGIYSAGLNRRDADAQIVLAGVQSIYRKAREICHRDFVVIDEAHLIGRKPGGMYRKLLAELRAINPELQIVGLTATPYRLDSGLLHTGKDRLFDSIAFSLPLLRMVEEGYLCPVRPKRPAQVLDVTGVGTRCGEFIQTELEAAVDQAPLTAKIVDEIVGAGHDKGSWLIFCSGVRHAEHVRDEIRKRGFSCETVTGTTPSPERDRILHAYKSGELRAVTNVGVLTTGFDAPGTDLIALLRPTQSTGLYVQMLGRGMRLAEGKDLCLVLDFAGNTARHGPVDTVDGTRGIRGERNGEGGAAPTKVCPGCSAILHAATSICGDCGHEFLQSAPVLAAKSATDAVLSNQRSTPWIRVTRQSYRLHHKPDRPASLRVDYECGTRTYSEWICLEHSGYPRQKAAEWWHRRAPGLPVPATVAQALRLASALPAASEIVVEPAGQYHEIRQVRFADGRRS